MPNHDVALTFFLTILVTFMRDKRKPINVQRNAKHLSYKYHGRYVNSPVVIIVKSCLKVR